MKVYRKSTPAKETDCVWFLDFKALVFSDEVTIKEHSKNNHVS